MRNITINLFLSRVKVDEGNQRILLSRVIMNSNDSTATLIFLWLLWMQCLDWIDHSFLRSSVFNGGPYSYGNASLSLFLSFFPSFLSVEFLRDNWKDFPETFRNNRQSPLFSNFIKIHFRSSVSGPETKSLPSWYLRNSKNFNN